MQHYTIWCNLRESHRDLDFVAALDAYLGSLQRQGLIASWHLTRRTLGFGPPELGEFQIVISVADLGQLDRALVQVATRAEPIEGVHRAVYSMVTDFRSALYRDFPDASRGQG
jgi:hypothetical protein